MAKALNTLPRFAVVGHPNKGKSSIVATLARDDTVSISQRSGTTTSSESWTYANEGGRYELVDTPGFQRPRAVMAWLRQHAPNAHERAATVAAFVADPECQQRFPDEVELLRPVVEGAAILYVVDGSRPYSPEYETEMEILRWTGQPSMGLINPIESHQHVQDWQQALEQYFRLARVFDPMQPQARSQAELLRAFALLQPQWQATLEQIARHLEQEADSRRVQAARLLASWLGEATQFSVCQQVVDKALIDGVRPLVQSRFGQQLQQAEQETFQQLMHLFQYRQTELETTRLQWPGELLDRSQWKLWGLSRKQLYLAAASAGAGAGGVVDVALLGHSFMAGALIGGLAGAGSAWWASDRLEKLRISALAGSRWEVCAGPVSDNNFPFVLLARFAWLYQQLQQRTHARRDAIRMQPLSWEEVLQKLNGEQRKQLYSALGRLSKQKTVDDLYRMLEPVLQAHETLQE